jgi:hypothetical protein
MGSPKAFIVSFTETTGYRVPVLATDADDAVAKAQDLFERVGPEPAEGFDFDHSIEGGTDDWEARALDPGHSSSGKVGN